MTDENVIAFEPRRTEAPVLHCELRLNEADCSITMTLHDHAGNVVAPLEYTLASKPADFSLAVLRAAWGVWREQSEAS